MSQAAWGGSMCRARRGRLSRRPATGSFSGRVVEKEHPARTELQLGYRSRSDTAAGSAVQPATDSPVQAKSTGSSPHRRERFSGGMIPRPMVILGMRFNVDVLRNPSLTGRKLMFYLRFGCLDLFLGYLNIFVYAATISVYSFFYFLHLILEDQ